VSRSAARSPPPPERLDAWATDMINPVTAQGDTAARHLLRDVLVARASEPVGITVERLRRVTPQSVEAVYITDAGGHLTGLVPLARLLSASDETLLGTLADQPVAPVTANTDQEHVASLAVAGGVTEIPIVLADGGFLGVVPARALLDILRREHIEDMRRFVGMLKEGERASHALQVPPLRRLYERLPWLLVGLVGSLVATVRGIAGDRLSITAANEWHAVRTIHDEPLAHQPRVRSAHIGDPHCEFLRDAFRARQQFPRSECAGLDLRPDHREQPFGGRRRRLTPKRLLPLFEPGPPVFVHAPLRLRARYALKVSARILCAGRRWPRKSQ